MFNFNTHLNRYFVLPAILVVASLAAIGVWGLRPGIDLSGGSLVQVTYTGERPAVEQVRALAEKLELGEVRIQPAQQSSYILRTRALTNDEKNNLTTVLGGLGAMNVDQFTTVGPTIGTELLHKAWIAVVLVVLCIIAFIAFAFRGVSRPVASWKYGVVAVITLLFDVLVPVGVFAALGHFANAEVDTLFIVALLTILGISINDKIVVFDRIRENLLRSGGRAEFAATVEKSVRQTLARSINTSLTVIIVLLALYVLGPAATKVFALTLVVGMVVGTYSSIFFASPLLVFWQRHQKKA